LLAAHAADGARGPENGLRLLSPWLRLLPPPFHLFLLCDMALYAGRAQRHEEAACLLQQARQALSRSGNEGADDAWYRHWYARMTTARGLLSGGKAVEALARLPAADLIGDGRIAALLVWAEASLAAGEKNMASRALSEAQTLLAETPLPQRQSRLDQLA